MKQPGVKDQIEGVLVGLACGDALGAALEFLPRSEVRRRHPAPLRDFISSDLWQAGQYTDDTEMTLLLGDSLVELGKLDPLDIAARFRNWTKTATDVGIQTRRVVSRPDYLLDPISAVRQDYIANPDRSAGNGAVMRCAPIALFHLDSLQSLLLESERSALITHGDRKAHSSCVLLNVAIREAILNGARDYRQSAVELLSPEERQPWHRLISIESLKEEEISSSGYTVSTVEAAYWSFLTTNTFEAAIVRAANLGDDADTVAAVTGALAGAFYGHSAIPERWRQGLKDEPRIRRLAEQLTEGRFQTD
jgi:ADP-ribosyl-[dinitrogen reductase] hydrolase